VDCYAGGVVFAWGSVEDGSLNEADDSEGMRMNMLLAGQGGLSAGASPCTLHEGDMVGIRAPTWDVNIAGEKWLVGVDWVVL
jgi:hypothetical protein